LRSGFAFHRNTVPSRKEDVHQWNVAKHQCEKEDSDKLGGEEQLCCVDSSSSLQAKKAKQMNSYPKRKKKFLQFGKG
jgi:hypothetical protein